MAQVLMQNDLLGPAEAPEDGVILAVAGVNVTYHGSLGQFHAVKDVDLTLKAGEQVAIVGESGSGKTTLGMAIAGFLTDAVVTTTRFQLNGEPVDRRPVRGLASRTPGIGMIFQDAMTSLDPVWTIGSQLKHVLRAGRKVGRGQLEDEARGWLHRVGLTDTRRVMKARPYELSGGMRQRAMMAIALSGRPSLLIADEPTSALDASLSRAAMELMRSLTTETGTTLLVISHDVKLCSDYTDRMVVMYRGEVVETGSSATLAGDARHPYTKGLLACVPTIESRHLRRLPVLSDFMGEG